MSRSDRDTEKNEQIAALEQSQRDLRTQRDNAIGVNRNLLDQNARLTMRVTLLELALEALGINHSTLGEDEVQALAERQHSLAASEAHPQTMIGRANGTG